VRAHPSGSALVAHGEVCRFVCAVCLGMTVIVRTWPAGALPSKQQQQQRHTILLNDHLPAHTSTKSHVSQAQYQMTMLLLVTILQRVLLLLEAKQNHLLNGGPLLSSQAPVLAGEELGVPSINPKVPTLAQNSEATSRPSCGTSLDRHSDVLVSSSRGGSVITIDEAVPVQEAQDNLTTAATSIQSREPALFEDDDEDEEKDLSFSDNEDTYKAIPEACSIPEHIIDAMQSITLKSYRHCPTPMQPNVPPTSPLQPKDNNNHNDNDNYDSDSGDLMPGAQFNYDDGDNGGGDSLCVAPGLQALGACGDVGTTLAKLVGSLVVDHEEYIQHQKNRMAKVELNQAARNLGSVILEDRIPEDLLAKARAYLDAAAAQMNEQSECCDSYIIWTRFMNSICTEIVNKCVHEPVHDTESHNDDYADLESSEDDSDDEFVERLGRDSLQPNKTVLNGLSKFGNGASALPNSAVIGAKPPGSSSVLASASCNH
jgi:hypothetical protein